jgi:hypothetical protein
MLRLLFILYLLIKLHIKHMVTDPQLRTFLCAWTIIYTLSSFFGGPFYSTISTPLSFDICLTAFIFIWIVFWILLSIRNFFYVYNAYSTFLREKDLIKNALNESYVNIYIQYKYCETYLEDFLEIPKTRFMLRRWYNTHAIEAFFNLSDPKNPHLKQYQQGLIFYFDPKNLRGQIPHQYVEFFPGVVPTKESMERTRKFFEKVLGCLS